MANLRIVTAALLAGSIALTACKPAAQAPAAASSNAATTPASAAPARSATPHPVAYDPKLVEAATAAAKQAIASADPAKLVAGTDYVEIKNGQPFAPLDGKVEVVEVFSYRCPHCADFEPLLEAWTAQQPANVRVTPLSLGPKDDDLAKAFYVALQRNELALVHARLFRAIHGEQSLKPVPTAQDIATHLGAAGFDANAYLTGIANPAIDAQRQKALEFAQQAGVEGTPTIIVNGRYRVLGKSQLDYLRVASALVARESQRTP